MANTEPTNPSMKRKSKNKPIEPSHFYVTRNPSVRLSTSHLLRRKLAAVRERGSRRIRGAFGRVAIYGERGLDGGRLLRMLTASKLRLHFPRCGKVEPQSATVNDNLLELLHGPDGRLGVDKLGMSKASRLTSAPIRNGLTINSFHFPAKIFTCPLRRERPRSS